MTGTPVTLHPPLAEEDRARAEFYALLGRLYVAAPDAPLLAAIGASDLRGDADSNPLSAAWNQLVLASRAMDAEAAEQEYTDLFVGVGKAECNLHAAYWIPDAAQRPLVNMSPTRSEPPKPAIIPRRVIMMGLRTGIPACESTTSASQKRQLSAGTVPSG